MTFRDVEKKAKCPKCGKHWQISARGDVNEKYRKYAEETGYNLMNGYSVVPK